MMMEAAIVLGAFVLFSALALVSGVAMAASGLCQAVNYVGDMLAAISQKVSTHSLCLAINDHAERVRPPNEFTVRRAEEEAEEEDDDDDEILEGCHGGGIGCGRCRNCRDDEEDEQLDDATFPVFIVRGFAA